MFVEIGVAQLCTHENESLSKPLCSSSWSSLDAIDCARCNGENGVFAGIFTGVVGVVNIGRDDVIGNTVIGKVVVIFAGDDVVGDVVGVVLLVVRGGVVCNDFVSTVTGVVGSVFFCVSGGICSSGKSFFIFDSVSTTRAISAI